MSDKESDPELSQLLTDLTTTLRDLDAEVKADRPRGPRLPTPRELSRFTSEVAIPGIILLLQTNIRALQLLQRAIRLANGEHPSPEGSVAEVRTRAEAVGRASLSQLDHVLSDLQSALEARPENEEARELLSRAQSLRQQVRDELDGEGTTLDADESERASVDESDAVDIDIESELQSIKDNMDRMDSGGANGGGDSGSNGEGDGRDGHADEGGDSQG